MCIKKNPPPPPRLSKVLGYLSEDECEVAARNVTRRLDMKPA